MRAFFRVAIAVLLASTLFAAQAPRSDAKHKYFLLATKRTSTMQQELDQAAAAGYRIVVGSPTSGQEMAVLMEKQGEDLKNVQYKLLATNRTSTMEKELNEAANTGFRLLPRTMIAKATAFVGIEIVCVLERNPNVNKRYHYKLLATTLTSTLQKEIDQAITDGYTLAGIVSRDEHMVIMEKESAGD